MTGWQKDHNEVPLPNAGYYWSVSHKPQWAAAVVADRPVGIDIEHMRPRPRKLHDALADDQEWRIIGDRSWYSFYRLWTAKEATLKATGLGIGGFKTCRLVDAPDKHHVTLHHEGETWQVAHYEHARHVVAVTCSSASVNWCVIETTDN